VSYFDALRLAVVRWVMPATPDRCQRIRAAFFLHCSEFVCVPGTLGRYPLSDFGISKVNPPRLFFSK